MKKLLILMVLGLMLGGMAGCRFMECMWRGGPPAQQTCQPAGTVVCPNTCQPDPCGCGVTAAPGPTYAH